MRAVAGTRAPFGSWLLGPEGQSLRRLRVRVQLFLTLGITATHAIGAGVVVVLTLFVVPQPGAGRDLLVALAIAVPVYVGLALGVGVLWGTRVAFRSLRWALRGEEPSPADRRRSMRVPLQLAVVSATLWCGGVLLFTTLALWLAPARALGTAPTVAIGGIVVCAVTYLMAEFFLRPVSARALTGSPESRPRGLGVGGRMLTFWLLGTAAPLVGLGYAAISALAQGDVSADRMAVLALAISAVVLVFGLLVTVLNARSVVAPLVSVRKALARVQDGDLDQRVPVYDATELGLLQAGFNHMAEGLTEREHLRDLFGRHVGQEVARAAAAGDVELGGETRRVTVLFVDLVGSTAIAADRSPTEVVELLNGFFDVVVDEIAREGGLVNKFMGDAVLAIFGAPVDLPDHATRGLRAARAMVERLGREHPDLDCGVGVFTGETVAGNVGTRARFEYTVIGDAVNAAARLTELAKDVEGRVLTCAESLAEADEHEAAQWRSHERATLRGRTEETELFVRR
ncbi:MAG: adenylate/guanylate cyclase domain-containing protein [Actinomycetota bacterium]|nr:adenylate/guanylate cyclase domain-containing protein [Actinomycetota bacterium]